MNKKRDFFISYNKDDKQQAKWIAAVLEAEGYTSYLQAWDFRAGENFILNMNNILKRSKRFIAVLSKKYLESLYCQAEWAVAFNEDPTGKKRKFIPVRIEDIKPDGLLGPIIYIDLFEADEPTAKQLLIYGVDPNDIPRKMPPFPGFSGK